MSVKSTVHQIKFQKVTICLILAVFMQMLLPLGSADAWKGGKGKPMQAALSGPTIQVDPGFSYYKDRSPESIADEIVQNGYTSVRYFVANENNVDRELVVALQKRGIFVWALVLGNGSYSVEGFPAEWPEWQM